MSLLLVSIVVGAFRLAEVICGMGLIFVSFLFSSAASVVVDMALLLGLSNAFCLAIGQRNHAADVSRCLYCARHSSAYANVFF